jgi:type II restriction/modification system DNA methylase subunit YeeA
VALTASQFVERWRGCSLTERSAAQSHFLDLCEMLGEPHPAAADGAGERFAFEKRVSRTSGKKGFADVWFSDHFAWEYKGKHKDLNEAYRQLNDYREDLGNPPLLVVCDLDRFEVHTNFDRTRVRVYQFDLADLLIGTATPKCPLPPLDVLRCLFADPDKLSPEATAARVTEDAAEKFCRLAESIELDGADPRRGQDPHRVAHFLMRLLFCLFADSIGLLPRHMFREMIETDRGRPQTFQRKLRTLFQAMSGRGNSFGPYDIHFFNGGLFDNDEVLTLNAADMGILYGASRLDWSTIEPSIFGTLFERSLNAQKRAKIGAHYTSPADIALIIEPVVMEPLRRRWAEVRARVAALAGEANNAPKGQAYNRIRRQMQEAIAEWMEQFEKVRILDPACGSGNFLYIALRRLLDLWWEASTFAAEHGLATILPRPVNPSQLYGIEIDFYAHELASIVVWIGYLQWRHEHGMGVPTEPILEKLDNIQHRDAILAHDADGDASEAEWPEADFVVGNPPFLGGKRLRQELNNRYVDDLFRVFEGRVAPEADLVVYWFEKAREALKSGKARRVGLLATQAIRGGANREVLDRIKDSARIFMAWSDQPWILDGAAVRISIVGFEQRGDEEPTGPMLNGKSVTQINSDLTSGTDATTASPLPENAGILFQGPVKVGKFEISQSDAHRLLAMKNPNSLSNSLVVKPWINASDIVRRHRNLWIIDFGDRSEADAALFEAPFELVRRRVKPFREKNHDRQRREYWWRLGRSGTELKAASKNKTRLIVTPRVSKHRIFVWVTSDVVPDSRVYVFARDDDYFFGVLQSRAHEVWTLANCSWHGVGNDPTYVSRTCFETFPFPWPPGQEPMNPYREAIAQAGRELVRLRENRLSATTSRDSQSGIKTLTDLYNERPTWLENAHRDLDRAVFAAYGWKYPLDQNGILERLLELNRQRAAGHPQETISALPPKKAPGVERPPAQRPSRKALSR